MAKPEFWMTPDEAEDVVHDEELERQYRADLAWVVRDPAGARFITRLLENMGAERQVYETPGAIALHNFACRLIDQIAEANGPQAMNILAALRGITR